MGVKPSLPPKASFGDIKAARLYVAGDPDNKGYLWYSNVNTLFDWSSETCVLPAGLGYDTNGGGYVSSVDDDGNAFPIGGLVAHYGNIYLFGTSERPYLSVLSGDSPAEYSLSPIMQQTDAFHKTVKSLKNDVWFKGIDSVHHLAGVQEYGDVRTMSVGDPVKDKIKLLTTNKEKNIAGYNAADGQYCVTERGFSNCLVCNTTQPRQGGGRTFYPWVEYQLTSRKFSCFFTYKNVFAFGSDDGNIYAFDDSVYSDDGNNDIVGVLATGWMTLPFGSTWLRDVFFNIHSTAGFTLVFDLYINNDDSNRHRRYTYTYTAGQPPIFQKELNVLCDNFRCVLSVSGASAAVTVKGVSMTVGRKQMFKG
jgi:hypothetical protein